MLAVKGYYNGSSYVTEEDVAVKPNQKVIITLLDDFVPTRARRSLADIKFYMNSSSKSIPSGMSAVDYVRRLREE